MHASSGAGRRAVLSDINGNVTAGGLGQRPRKAVGAAQQQPLQQQPQQQQPADAAPDAAASRRAAQPAEARSGAAGRRPTVYTRRQAAAGSPEQWPPRTASARPHTAPRPVRTDLLALDYVDSIYEHFKATETKHVARRDYMERRQVEITADMRATCLDWVIEVATLNHMQEATLHLCANILDRFLAAKAICQARMQLVSMVCLIIAAKYEEIYPPRIQDYIHISANYFNEPDMLRYEHYVLHALNYTLTVPTPHSFLTAYLHQLGITRTPDLPAARAMKDMSLFLAECALLSLDLYLKELPSLLAAACIYGARQTLGLAPVWPPEVGAGCQWDVRKVAALAEEVIAQAKAVGKSSKLKSTYKRYSDASRSSVAHRLQ